MFVQSHNSPETIREMSRSQEYIDSRDRLRTVYFAMKGDSISIIASKLDRSITYVKNWVKRYNDNSLPGILKKSRSPRKPRLEESLQKSFIKRVLAGPNENDNTACFTGEDLQILLAKEYNCFYSLAGVYLLMKRLGLSYTKPRPIHPKTDKTIQKKWLQKDLPFF